MRAMLSLLDELWVWLEHKAHGRAMYFHIVRHTSASQASLGNDGAQEGVVGEDTMRSLQCGMANRSSSATNVVFNLL